MSGQLAAAERDARRRASGAAPSVGVLQPTELDVTSPAVLPQSPALSMLEKRALDQLKDLLSSDAAAAFNPGSARKQS